MITPGGSTTGFAAGEPRIPKSTGEGRPRWMGNRRDQHLAANHEDWANETIGEAPYQNKLMILRNRGNYRRGSKSTVEGKWKSSAGTR